jgi:V-type H+-transporting ATPase subunit D
MTQKLEWETCHLQRSLASLRQNMLLVNNINHMHFRLYINLLFIFLYIGNFRNTVLEGQMTASVRVTSRTDNVAGVKLPVFSQVETGSEVSKENLGLIGGGRKIAQCKEKFAEYLQALIKLASLQTSFLAMDEALKVTSRRVNALENVTIPKIVAVLDMINRCTNLLIFFPL